MKLSIIILNHNSGDFLKNCVESIFADDIPFSFEIIIPDNASTDNSLGKVKERWGSRVHIINNPRNGGFAYGSNIGIRYTSGEYICLINPDTIVHRGTFKNLIEFMDAHPQVGFTGPKVMNNDGTIQLSARRSIPSPFDAISRALWLSKLFPKSKTFARYNLTYNDPNKTQQVDASTGCCMVARRGMIDNIGLLDENFFLYCEDVDWFLRAKNAGWQTYYVATALIDHHHSYSEQFRKYRSIADFHHSMIYFHKKHYAEKYLPVFNWLIYSMVYTRMLAIMILKTFKGWK